MDLKLKIKKAPRAPGVYMFKNKRGETIYAGKAANLRARLSSYARPGWKENMLREASSLSWKELGSEIEALIREAAIIKTCAPRYNIAFRDDKNYLYVVFSKTDFPRVSFTHQPRRGMDAIGPFTDAASVRKTMRALRKAFPYCTCTHKALHARKCVNGEIGKCPGYCCVKNMATAKAKLAYAKNIKNLKKILTGKSKKLMKELEKQMRSLSSRRQYEEAGRVRNKLLSLKQVFAHSRYLKKDIPGERIKALKHLKNLLGLPDIPRRIEGYDISHTQGSYPVGSMAVFIGGQMRKSEYRKFIVRTISGINDPAMIGEILRRRLKHGNWPLPQFILVDGGRAQLNAARKTLRGRRLAAIPIAAIAKREEELYVPKRTEPHALKSLPGPLLHMLTGIRDEAHRFAVSFHRRRSRKALSQNMQ